MENSISFLNHWSKYPAVLGIVFATNASGEAMIRNHNPIMRRRNLMPTCKKAKNSIQNIAATDTYTIVDTISPHIEPLLPFPQAFDALVKASEPYNFWSCTAPMIEALRSLTPLMVAGFSFTVSVGMAL